MKTFSVVLLLSLLAAIVSHGSPTRASIRPHASSAPTASNEVLPFIQNDYPRALAEARARKVPLFVDTWAPWCHTCRSMTAYVFTDQALAGQSKRFVWLSLDTEKGQNAAITKSLKIQAIPTYFILDPTDGRVALRWVGAATVPQLEKILDDGIAAVAGGAKPSGSAPESAEEALARADRLYAQSDYAAAAKAYPEALAQAPEGWARYSRAVESLLFALSMTNDYQGAAQLALGAFPRLSRTPSAANVAASGLDAALSMPESLAVRKDLIAALSADSRAVLADSSILVAADDRAAVYSSLYDARKDAKDDPGAAVVAGQWVAYLDDQAARADTPEKRTALDPDRLNAYLELGQPERAISMLEQSQRDFPEDYNPSARLALVYKTLKDWDKALAASDRAMLKAYGPRKLGIFRTRADIFVGRGDTPGARKVLEEAIQMAQALPDGQRSESTIAALKKKLTGLAGGS